MLLMNVLLGAMTTGCALVAALAAFSYGESSREIRQLNETD
jgi:hypothetical protein